MIIWSQYRYLSTHGGTLALGYATQMTPQKGGYTTPAPALDLTTSLRGDLHVLLVSTDRPPPSCPPAPHAHTPK